MSQRPDYQVFQQQLAEMYYFYQQNSPSQDYQQLCTALNNAQMQLAAVMQTAVDAIILADMQGNILSWNKGAKNIFGYEREEVIGQPLTLLIPERFREAHERGMQRVNQTHQTKIIDKTVELAGIHKNGSEFPLELSLSTWVMGEDRFYSGIIRDITNHKITEQALTDKNQQLQTMYEKIHEQNQALIALNQEKNEFLSIAAHDLKNPLSAIKGFAEEIESDFNSLSQEEILETVGLIQKAARQMFSLISNLLDVNVIETGKMSISIESQDIYPLVERMVESYRKAARSKQITLHVQADTPPYLATVDEHLTTQILDNLISNAIKYSPYSKSIEIKLQQGKTHVRFSVKDEGPGLDAQEQAQLFTKFTRLSPQPTGNEHTTGLGLFIVKKLTDMLNAQIYCETELGEGTMFIVDFPTTTS